MLKLLTTKFLFLIYSPEDMYFSAFESGSLTYSHYEVGIFNHRLISFDAAYQLYFETYDLLLDS